MSDDPYMQGVVVEPPTGVVRKPHRPSDYRKPHPSRPYVSRIEADSGPADANLFNTPELPEDFIYRYKTEKAEHRIIAFLKSQGLSGREIAERTGYCLKSVYDILRLPWVRDVVIDEIRRQGRDAVQDLLVSGTQDAVHLLEEIMQDPKAASRDRIACAKEFLNRVYGMPNQPVTHHEGKDLSSLSDQELAQIVSKGRGN